MLSIAIVGKTWLQSAINASARLVLKDRHRAEILSVSQNSPSVELGRFLILETNANVAMVIFMMTVAAILAVAVQAIAQD